MILLELFSGIGGFAKGLHDAGFNFNKHYFSDVDKHAIANYKYNFKNAQYIGAVQHVRGSEIERPHIITFGSPCQDFSLAGKQLGMHGQRSVLILEAIRIITETRPSVFIWENVKGAFSSRSGADFWAILKAFTNIGGYRLEWQLLNTSWFLPQNRERIYLVGHLTTESTGDVFPITKTNFRPFEGTTKTPIVRTLTAGGNSGGRHSGMTLVKQVNNIDVTNLQGKKVCNTIRSGGGGSLTNKHNWDMVEIRPVLTPYRKNKRQNGRRFKENGEASFTLNCQDQHGVQINNSIRRLTEIECERLQGFPDDWTRYGYYLNIKMDRYLQLKKSSTHPDLWLITYCNALKTFKSDHLKEITATNRYKMHGNAATSTVVRSIGERINIKIS